MGQIRPEQADTQTVAKKREGVDPVARLQERARWSSFTNTWTGFVAPGRAPRWLRRTIIAVFVLMIVGGIVGLIGLLTYYW
jgi:hypothetical protein